MADRVWYVSYGSNLLRARFLTYLTGGPIPGATDGQEQPGSRDRSLPLADSPVEIDRTLVFAKKSTRWGGGGVAFLDPDEHPATPTRGRAWNITCQQLEDVYRQENRQPEPVAIHLGQLAQNGYLDGYSSSYGRLLFLGPGQNGLPLVTLTAAARPRDTNPAHPSYLGVMAEGLSECWDLSQTEAQHYLASLPQRPKRPLAEHER